MQVSTNFLTSPSATPQVGASFEVPEGDDSEEGSSYDSRITYGGSVRWTPYTGPKSGTAKVEPAQLKLHRELRNIVFRRRPKGASGK